MNTLTKNRILEAGDEYRANGIWKPVPDTDIGLQIGFTKYSEVRRPSEAPPATPHGVPYTPEVADYLKAQQQQEPFTPWQDLLTEKQKAELPPHLQQGSQTVRQESAKLPIAGSIPAPASKPISPNAPEAPKAEDETSTPAATHPVAGGSPTAEDILLKMPLHRVGLGTSQDSIIVKYPKGNDCIWTGRNGTFNGVALEAMSFNDKIMLSPMGKRGVGNCTIQFPVSVIPDLIDWLQRQLH